MAMYCHSRRREPAQPAGHAVPDYARIGRLSPLSAGDEGRVSGGELGAGFGVNDRLKCLEQRIPFGARPSKCHEVKTEAS
jgi:hypothetical protein